MTEQAFDIVVIGGGPGGYPAAIKAAQLGKSVALVEAGLMGGTCLNRGCIPTKTLLANAHALNRVREAEHFGIHVDGVSFDYAQMIARKNSVVGGIRKGLEGLIQANKITVFQGHGRLTGPRHVKVTGEQEVLLKADSIILATGSEPRVMPAFPFDGKKIHSSTSILDITQLPKRIVIIGAGYIGCEFASLFRDLDVDVVLLEMMNRILPMEDEYAAKALEKVFKKKSIDMRMGVKVDSVDTSGKGVRVALDGGETVDADMVLVSIGRKLNTDTIGLDAAGVSVDPRGAIPVDAYQNTNVPGIYAIGDITMKWMLAHVATHQGVIAGENAAGGNVKMHYDAVPSVVFTNPEIGTVGLTLYKAQEAGYNAERAAFPFQALGKSQAALETDGFAQVVVDKKTGQILGAQVVGHEASTLIAQMALAMANELTIDCVSDTIHAPPTVAEAWMEAALLAQGTPLHLPPKPPRKT
ncbi:MAG: dihydrolipoyl dehydrogenase [Chlamydiia bacterium]|nr:dihydrolipoyl dehydrogenase [Chlamydiia bacterium]